MVAKKKVIKKVAKKKPIEIPFSYCIGGPWEPNDPNSPIYTYAYGSEIFYGTTKEAKAMKKFIEGCDHGQKYDIYKLVKI